MGVCNSIELVLTLLAQQLRLHRQLVILHTVRIGSVVEQNQERQSLLGQLLGILERDLAHQRHTLLLRPNRQLIDVGQAAGERLIVVVRQIGVRSEHDNRRAGRMHLRHHIAEAHVERAVVLQVCGHPLERVVFDLIAPIEVADDNALFRVQLLQFAHVLVLDNRIDQLLPDELDESVLGARTAILALGRLPVDDQLERWVLGDLEARRDGGLLVTVHGAHDNLAGIREQFVHADGRLLEDGLQDAAEATPVRVEVEEHDLIGR